MDKQETKICLECSRELPIDQFHHRQRKTMTYIYKICKDCYHKRQKKYRDENREKCTEGNLRWCQKNRKRSNEIKAKYKRNHLEQNRAYNREYSKKYREKHKDDLDYKAKKAAHDSKRRQIIKDSINDQTIDMNKIAEFYKKAKELNIAAGYVKYHVDHIIPLSKGGRHHQDNLQIILAEENLRKHNKLPEDI